jgi:hypothetical protein
MDFTTGILISLAVGIVFLITVIPFVAVMLLTLGDIVFRVDTGISKLFWIAAVLFVPIGGMLLYWLFRPKRFDPLHEKEEFYASWTYHTPAATSRPALRALPAQAGPPAPQGQPVELDRAA